jgi:hypothetical protein
MWQTIVTVILFLGAAAYVGRHFLRVFRTGNDCTCSGCSSSGCRGGKHLDVGQACDQDNVKS